MTDELPNRPSIYPQQHGVARLGDEQERRVWEFVEAVVLCTRLWRDERNDVRMELLHHFDDGVDAGQSLEQLFQDFGSPVSAARMIRVAKMRNRPWSWQVRHRVFQACLAGLGLMLVGVLILEARLHLIRSGPAVDYVGQFDQATNRVAVEDRGWPEYRQGLTLLDRTQLVRSREAPALSLRGTPADPHWNQLVKYLDENARAIDLFVQAAQHSRLGYVYRDPANDPWLKVTGFRPSAELFPVDVPCDRIWLQHLQELGYVRDLLYSSAIRALENRDLPGFRKYWEAQCGLAAQILAEATFMPAQSVGRSSAGSALALLRYLVYEHAELLSDEQLADCRRDLETVRWETTASTSNSLRPFYEDLLQRTFTAEADGGGHLTSDGCRALRRQLEMASTDALKWGPVLAEKELTGVTSIGSSDQSVGVTHTARQEISALRWSATLASRRELRVEIERLMSLLQDELDKPLATTRDDFEGTEYLADLERIAENSDLSRRYWPLLLIMPTRDYTYFFPERGRESMVMAREGTLATIALEQYRRRTGKWPEQLEQLVPTDLPQVPRDMFTGRPLIYRVVAGKPLLYSVWMDREDDSGRPFPKGSNIMESSDGDLRLLPVE